MNSKWKEVKIIALDNPSDLKVESCALKFEYLGIDELNLKQLAKPIVYGKIPRCMIASATLRTATI
jgi:hypothetical protein